MEKSKKYTVNLYVYFIKMCQSKRKQILIFIPNCDMSFSVLLKF